jgi:SAM-dependent methyltransferase
MGLNAAGYSHRVCSADVRAFARTNLPSPPARILEVGAGGGEVGRALSAVGYSVVAIDPEPTGESVIAVALHELDEQPASFDAALAVLSLHHVNPLDKSCERLADVLRPGATLLIDEFDVACFDHRAAAWWLEQRRVIGASEDATSEELVEDHRAHLHSVERIVQALQPRFEVGAPLRGSYLYRWDLNKSLRDAEEELIAEGRLPAVGARFLARRHA